MVNYLSGFGVGAVLGIVLTLYLFASGKLNMEGE